MAVHAAAVVAVERLGHERRASCRASCATFLTTYLNHISWSGHLDEAARTSCRSRTARRTRPRGGRPRPRRRCRSSVSHHLWREGRRARRSGDREVALLVADLVAEVRARLCRSSSPPLRSRCEYIEPCGPRLVADLIEDEELGFGTEEHRVADAALPRYASAFLRDDSADRASRAGR